MDSQIQSQTNASLVRHEDSDLMRDVNGFLGKFAKTLEELLKNIERILVLLILFSSTAVGLFEILATLIRSHKM